MGAYFYRLCWPLGRWPTAHLSNLLRVAVYDLPLVLLRSNHQWWADHHGIGLGLRTININMHVTWKRAILRFSFETIPTLS
jgi:hypothetical protein